MNNEQESAYKAEIARLTTLDLQRQKDFNSLLNGTRIAAEGLVQQFATYSTTPPTESATEEFKNSLSSLLASVGNLQNVGLNNASDHLRTPVAGATPASLPADHTVQPTDVTVSDAGVTVATPKPE